MHLGKLNILLLVLVFSLDFVRSEEDYAPAIPDDADEAVDDDAGVADDANGDVATNNDAVADDDAINDDAMPNDPVNGDIVEAESVNPVDPPAGMDDPNPIHTCVPGTHFKVDCNYCYCFNSGIQSCTFIFCGHGDMKLSSNPAKRLAFKKLREHATGCIPGEKVKHELTNCECSCTIPSVLTCPENCLR
ncbi:uncharacterized protein LOC134672920 [Cydia fagiglandana]|uniref:uncharacterized protein LOC134672920 n=1 Tax=Cydia fagiglandana TaxID=1458189 RepID=UPI002FEDF2CC